MSAAGEVWYFGALANREFEVHGFEISQTAAQGADPRAQIRIADDLKEARYLTDCFDQVILWRVLEHLPNPRETLEEIHWILKPGGRLSVAVPNFSSLQARWARPAWFHLDLPRHLFHFTLPSLKRLLRDCGFHCRKEHHFSLRQNPFGWVQSAFNRSPNMPRNSLYSLLKQQAESKNGMFDSSLLWKLQLGNGWEFRWVQQQAFLPPWFAAKPQFQLSRKQTRVDYNWCGMIQKRQRRSLASFLCLLVFFMTINFPW